MATYITQTPLYTTLPVGQQIIFAVNNTWVNVGSGVGDPANGNNPAVSNLENNYSTGGTNNIGYYLQLRDAVAENKPEFDGRFFAKIEKDEVLKTNVLGTKVSYEVQNTYRVGYIAAAKWNRAMTAEDVDDPDNFIAGAYNTSATNTWPGNVFTADEVRFNYGYND